MRCKSTRFIAVSSSGPIWTGVVARWGYPELVDDPMHFNAIVDGDPAALEIFNKHFSVIRHPTWTSSSRHSGPWFRFDDGERVLAFI